MNRAGLQPLLRDPRLWRGAGAAEIKAAPTGHAALDAVLPGGGWPRGALSEILHPFPGVGELTLALPLLVRLTQQLRSIALLAPPQLPAAPAWAAAGVALARMLVVQPQAEADALWAAEQLLHAGAGAVLLWRERIDPTALRRLQLAAAAGDGMGLLYRPLAAEREASVAALRLRIERRHGEPQIEVLKCRGARPTGRYALGGPAVSTHPPGRRLSA